MRLPGWHRRVRNKLALYLDGELSLGDQRRLEDHLAACEACRIELAELRAVKRALGSIPLEDAPRSFALTPGMLEGPRRSGASTLRRLEMASRLAAAGLAVALAVVLVADLRGGQEAGPGPAAAPKSAADRLTEGMQGLAPPEGGDLAGPSAESTPSAASAQDFERVVPPTPAATAPAAANEETSGEIMIEMGAGEQASDDGGGLSAVAIGLAAGLGLTVAASGALTIGRRRSG